MVRARASASVTNRGTGPAIRPPAIVPPRTAKVDRAQRRRNPARKNVGTSGSPVSRRKPQKVRLRGVSTGLKDDESPPGETLAHRGQKLFFSPIAHPTLCAAGGGRDEVLPKISARNSRVNSTVPGPSIGVSARKLPATGGSVAVPVFYPYQRVSAFHRPFERLGPVPASVTVLFFLSFFPSH